MKRVNLAVLPLILAAAACAPPTAQDSAEIRAGSAAWAAAVNAGDTETMVALYAEDARILPPNGAAGEGHDAVRAAFGGMVDAGIGIELSTVEAAAAGDIGHHVGTYTMSTGGSGKFVEVWRRQGDQWKIAADIWNSDQPAAGSGPILIGTHRVEDADRWLSAWQAPDGRRAEFAQNGAPSVRVFQSPQDPNLTGVIIEVDDLDALMAWLGSEEGAKAKAEDGVIDSTVQLLMEVK